MENVVSNVIENGGQLRNRESLAQIFCVKELYIFIKTKTMY